MYQIQIEGNLPQYWSEYLDVQQIQLLTNGNSLLFIPVPDQSTLIGLLNQLHNLNIKIISVNDFKMGISKKLS